MICAFVILFVSRTLQIHGRNLRGWVIGNSIYFSGQIGRGGETFEDDARQVMETIKALAERTGTDMSHVFKCTVMIDDMDNWPAFNEVYKSYFEPGRMPARSAFGADGLALGAPVEVECMAYVPQAAGVHR